MEAGFSTTGLDGPSRSTLCLSEEAEAVRVSAVALGGPGTDWGRPFGVVLGGMGLG